MQNVNGLYLAMVTCLQKMVKVCEGKVYVQCNTRHDPWEHECAMLGQMGSHNVRLSEDGGMWKCEEEIMEVYGGSDE